MNLGCVCVCVSVWGHSRAHSTGETSRSRRRLCVVRVPAKAPWAVSPGSSGWPALRPGHGRFGDEGQAMRSAFQHCLPAASRRRLRLPPAQRHPCLSACPSSLSREGVVTGVQLLPPDPVRSEGSVVMQTAGAWTPACRWAARPLPRDAVFSSRFPCLRSPFWNIPWVSFML